MFFRSKNIKKYQKNASRLPLSWWFKPKPLSKTTISTALHSSSIRTPLTWCHRGIEAAAWWNGGWEVLAMCWSTALMFIKLKLRFLGVSLIYGAKLLPDICSKVIWGTCMCREICGIYTQLKNINSGLDFWCAFETKTRPLCRPVDQRLEISDPKRYAPPTWESLQARDVHNILQDWKNHTKESQVLPASMKSSGGILSPKRQGEQKWKVQIFKSYKSLISNRLGSWGKPEDLRWSPWKGKLAKVFLGEISVRVVMSLKSCLWRTSHDWNSSSTMTSHLCSIAHFPHWWSARRTWLQIVLPSKPSHREPKSVGCEVPISTAKS